MIAISLDPDLAASVIELVGALVLAACSIFVVPWLRSRASTASSESRRALYLDAIAKLDAAIGPAVAATEQVVARKLKASAPMPGKLTTEQADVALSHALAGVGSHFGTEQLDAIATALGLTRAGLEETIRTRIEAAVLDLRREPPMRVDAQLHTGPVVAPFDG